MVHTSSGTNGALAAAISASTQAMASPKPLTYNSSTAHGSTPEYQRRNETQSFNSGTEPDTLRLPKDREMNRSRSPSDIAAKLAAARYAPPKQRSLVIGTGRTDRQQNRGQQLTQESEAPTDTTSIAPTDILVNIFERKSMLRPSEAFTGSARRTSNQDSLSPKPLRPPVEGKVRLKWDDATGQQRRSIQTGGGMSAAPPSDVLSAHQASAQAVMPPEALNPTRAGLRAPKTDATGVSMDFRSRHTSQKPSSFSDGVGHSHTKLGETSNDSFRIGATTSAARVARRPPLPPPRRSSHLSRINLPEPSGETLDRSTSRSSNITRSTGTRLFGEPSSVATRGLSLENGTTLKTKHGPANGDKWRRTPLNTMTPHLTEDSLANAIVASSLASSRAPSPTKLNGPPLPARHVNAQKVLYYQQHHDNSLYSRTPSPAKSMRHTMRQPPSLDDEASNTPGAHRLGRRNLLKKHPNKHHEGDRKRWRDEVTERERKRYEGVWAANRGIQLAGPGTHGAPDESRSETTGYTMVLNVVVREIWLRSRLPDSVLAEIWDLVNNESTGMLLREEFVVGMWLIDQRLKGRKLPVKVSDSVWASVRHLSGIKLQAS